MALLGGGLFLTVWFWFWFWFRSDDIKAGFQNQKRFSSGAVFCPFGFFWFCLFAHRSAPIQIIQNFLNVSASEGRTGLEP